MENISGFTDDDESEFSSLGFLYPGWGTKLGFHKKSDY
jgi:hypothetical protein